MSAVPQSAINRAHTLALLCSHTYATGTRTGYVRGLLGTDAEVSTLSAEDVRALVVRTELVTYVAFRGTVPTDKRSVRRNLRYALVDDGGDDVHEGFRDSLLSIWRELIDCLANASAFSRVVLSGHSQGGAVATLAAVWLYREFLRNYNFRFLPSQLVTFAAPRAGGFTFGESLAKLADSGCSVERWTAANDFVPRLPPWWKGYSHGCGELYLSGGYDVWKDPAPWRRWWDGLCERLRTPTYFDAIESHRITEYCRKLKVLMAAGGDDV